MKVTLTVTLVLIVVRNQGGARANAITVSPNAVAVQRVLPSATDDAIVRRRATAGLTERGARLAGCPVAETAIGTHGA